MKLYTETSLKDFQTWSGASDTMKYLTDAEIETLEETLEEMYPDGMSETELNDILWFEDQFIADTLGYGDFEEIIDRGIAEN